MMPVPGLIGTMRGVSSLGTGHGPADEGVRVTYGLRAGVTIGVPEGRGAPPATGVTLRTGVCEHLGFGVCVALAVAVAVVATAIGGCRLLGVPVDIAVAVTSTVVGTSVLRGAAVAVGRDSDLTPQVTTKMMTKCS
jgi:hypothetical protein